MYTQKNNSIQTILPIIEKIKVEDIDPANIYKKVALENKYSFLLENLKSNGKSYSFIGISPQKIVKLKYISKNNTCIEYIDNTKGFLKMNNKDYIDFLKKELSKINYESIDKIPDFFASFVGYFGYEMVSLWEEVYHIEKTKDLRHGDLPLSILVIPKILLIIDQNEGIGYLINVIDLNSEMNQDDSIYLAKLENKKIIEKIKNKTPKICKDKIYNQKIKIKNHTKKEDFIKKVAKVKEYINTGEAFQIVLSQKFSCEMEEDPFEVYESLRNINPSPYMFYLNFDEVKLIGSSPEMLVKVEGQRVITRPLAGTRPRGETKEIDQVIEQELLSDEKERAEHIMLVDLARNDLGRVCEKGTVHVTKLFGVERYSHVMHIYSRVEGKKKEELSSLDVLKSVFPAGTVSGAPKIRAMEIIDELEDEPREIYAGVVGYIDSKDNLDTSIAIRTMVYKDKKLIIQAGAGIVSYSDAEKEYYETVNKSMAMFKSIKKGDFKDDSFDR